MKIKQVITIALIVATVMFLYSCDPCWAFKRSNFIDDLVVVSPRKSEYEIGDTVNFRFSVSRWIYASNVDSLDIGDSGSQFDVISEIGVTEAGFHYYGFDIIDENKIEVIRGIADESMKYNRLGTVIYDESEKEFIFSFRVIIEKPGNYEIKDYSEFVIMFNEDKEECDNYFFINTTVKETM